MGVSKLSANVFSKVNYSFKSFEKKTQMRLASRGRSTNHRRGVNYVIFV